MKIERIVVATDFSAPARVALEKAVAIAARFQARLYLFHAAFARGVEDVDAYRNGTLDDLYELAERRAREELAAVGAPGGGVPIVESIRVGPPADEIVAFADEKEADLIALGTHGRTGLRRLLLGSVAESVLRMANCPVLATRAPEDATPAPADVGPGSGRSQFQRILVAIDHSESARAALRGAVELARRFDGSVLAVHVLDDQVLAQAATLSPIDAVALEGSFAQMAKGDLDGFVAASLTDEQRRFVSKTIELGATAEAIQRVAREGNFDLIACGTHGRTGIRRALFGSTAERIVRLAPCPVYAVREGPAVARAAA